MICGAGAHQGERVWRFKKLVGEDVGNAWLRYAPSGQKLRRRTWNEFSSLIPYCRSALKIRSRSFIIQIHQELGSQLRTFFFCDPVWMNRLVLLVELAINKYTHWLSILMNDRILSDVNATPSNKNPLLVFETMSGFLMQYAIL